MKKKKLPKFLAPLIIGTPKYSHHWDRRNKQAKMMTFPYSFYRETDQLAVW
jgi:hypothetical protein